MSDDPIQVERDREHIARATLALVWLTQFVQGMIARFKPSELELALTILLARMVRTAYPGRTRAELAEHVRAGVLESLEGTDETAPEMAAVPTDKRGAPS